MRSFRSKKLSLGLWAVVVLLLTVFLTAPLATAQTERVLHSFGSNAKAGLGPASNLIFDSRGNLYGTTITGGTYNVGTVFELSPEPGGNWTETLLHSFATGGHDGQAPYAGIVFDSAGNLYGTTTAGGIGSGGIVFELLRPVPPSTHWSEKVLHNFLPYNDRDGSYPGGALLFDSAGNLYGTTQAGGDSAAGTVFELSPSVSGSWTEALIYSFSPNAKGLGDGKSPDCGLIFDSAGNLYGTTRGGGSLGNGTVFELTPSGGGAWTETVLYSFASGATDGAYPLGGLIFDSSGNLYGTASQGGPQGGGTVYKLTPSSYGGWTETVLYFFYPVFPSTDGNYPIGNVVFDSSGNLYGTTAEGGIGYCFGLGPVCGIVYKLTPAAGPWTETVLHYFNDNGSDGYYPFAGLVPGSGGNLYGATELGGTAGRGGGGTVFVINR
jgi:uncharacterized repeat protein (TIGR03803 family)